MKRRVWRKKQNKRNKNKNKQSNYDNYQVSKAVFVELFGTTTPMWLLQAYFTPAVQVTGK